MRAGEVGAQALRYWELRQAAAANNLANVSTPGFKAERVFARLLGEASVVADSETDFSPGALTPTGRTLDVALAGDGFFVVETSDGPRWTRGGSFQLDPTGTLVDAAGRPVLGENGALVVPPGEVQIGGDGTVSVDGAPVGRLRIQRPAGGAVPRRAGGGDWIPTDEVADVPREEAQVRQGYLEDSNVDPVGALVEMIEIQRAYAAVQRSMVTADEVMQTITTQIGRVG